jgi:hypothetical protein
MKKLNTNIPFLLYNTNSSSSESSSSSSERSSGSSSNSEPTKRKKNNSGKSKDKVRELDELFYDEDESREAERTERTERNREAERNCEEINRNDNGSVEKSCEEKESGVNHLTCVSRIITNTKN